MVFETLESRCLLSVTMTPLGVLPGYTFSQPLAINNSGQVVGYCENTATGVDRAFLYSNGKMTDLGPGQAVGINSAGQVVMNYDDYVFVYSNGKTTEIPSGTDAQGHYVELQLAFDINDNGQILAEGYRATTPSDFNCIYSNGVFTDLGNNWDLIEPVAFNNSGEVVANGTQDPDWGYSYIYSGGSWTALTGNPGDRGWKAAGINNSGQVAGDYQPSGANIAHGFLYSNGVITDLGSYNGIDPQGVGGINDNGQVAIGTGNPDGTGNVLLWTNGTMANVSTEGTNITVAGINDSDQIIGECDSIAGGGFILDVPPPPVTTTTVVTAAAPPTPGTHWKAGDQVQLTATVTARSGTEAPTGAVTFMDGDTILGTGSLQYSANGVATATFTTGSIHQLTYGDNSITADYAGGDGFGASGSDSITIPVDKVVNVGGGTLGNLVTALRNIGTDIEKASEIVGQFMQCTPGIQLYPPQITKFEVKAAPTGEIDFAPGWHIDGGQVNLQLSLALDITAEAYWGLPLKVAGFSFSVTTGLGIDAGVQIKWNHSGDATYVGTFNGQGSVTIAGNLYVPFAKGVIAGSAIIAVPITLDINGAASVGLDLSGKIEGSIQYKGLLSTDYVPVYKLEKVFGPVHMAQLSTLDFPGVIDRLVQWAEGSGGSESILAGQDMPTAGAAAAPFAGDPLVVTAQPPANVTAGAPFGLTVTAENADGSTNTAFNGSVTISDPVQTLGGTTTVTAVNGVAIFSYLTLDQADPNGEDLDISANGQPDAYSNMITVSAAPATLLAMSMPSPVAVAAGSPFAVMVDAEDQFGNIDPTFNGNVTLAIGYNPGFGTLGGKLTEAAVDGVAGFYDLTLGTKGNGYMLTATSGSLAAISDPFNATDLLAVTVQPPASVTAGAPFGLTVTAENPNGSTDTNFNGSVTVSDASQQLGGTTTVTASSGVAAFAGLTLDTADSAGEDLVVSANGLAGNSTSYFTVSPAAATQLVVPALKGTVLAGGPLAIQVAAEDPYGNVDTSFKGSVTLGLGANPGGANLSGTLSVTASGGIAAFNNFSISKPGSGYTLKAASSGLTAGVGPAFNVGSDQLMVSTQPPASVTAGSPFGLTVEAVNGQGSVDASFNGSVTVADTSQTLGGSTTVTAINGVAKFSGLTLDQADAAGEVLAASSGGLPGAATNSLTVTAAKATQLVVPAVDTAMLSLTSSGDEIPTIFTGEPFGLQAFAEDQYGNVDTSFSGSVTLALASNTGGASLGGNTTVTASSGVATFSGLSISGPGSGDTLRASSSTLAGIGPAFNVTGDQLLLTTPPPVSVVAGTPLTVVVTAENGAGQPDTTFTGSVTLTDPIFGQSLGGTTTVTATGGVATFSGLTLAQAGPGNWLIAASGALPGANSDFFDVVPGTARQLAVIAPPPGNVSVGAPFQVDVAAEDAEGNVQTGFNGDVTMALSAKPGGATLGGTHAVAVVDGLAAFPGLSINQPGNGYTLTASATGLTPTTTTAVDVASAGAATQLVVTTQPPSSLSAGSSFGLTVTAEDSFGNVVTSFAGSVTVSSPSGASLGGTLTMTAINGVATFSGLTDDQAGSNVTLSATSTGLDAATTAPFTVSPLAATQLTVWGPDGASPGSAFGTIVDAEDQFGNLVPSFSGNLTLALQSNSSGATLGGTLSATATGGMAEFSGLTIDRAGSGYTLQAQSSGVSGTSAAFDVTADHLVVTSQPPSTASARGGFGLTVSAENAAGQVDGSFAGSVTVSLLDLQGTGATLGGVLSVPAAGGTATFSGLTLNETGDYMLSLGGSGVGGVVTDGIVVTPPAPPIDTTPLTTYNAVEGNSTGSQVLATFTDAMPGAAPADFSGTINWGDGTAAAPFTSANVTLASATFSVSGSHVYAGPGSYHVTVTIDDPYNHSATATNTAVVVADAALTDTTPAATYNVTAGKSAQMLLATFTDGNPLASASDFTPSVNWGGAVLLTPSVSVQWVSGTASTWEVIGNAIYAAQGSYPVSVTVHDAGGSVLTSSGKIHCAAAVALMADSTPKKTYNALEGNSTKTQVLATFTDANAKAQPGDFTPTVTWVGALIGTPTVSVQLVSRTKTLSKWKVLGSATYAGVGTYTTTVLVEDTAGNVVQSVGKTQFKVADAPLHDATAAKTYNAVEGGSTGTQVLASFTDGDPEAPVSDFSGTINWGDGQTTPFTSADVSLAAGVFSVSLPAGHTYAEAGKYSVSVSAKDAGGSSLTSKKVKFNVADAPLTDVTVATTYDATAGQSTGSQVLATFTDGNPGALATNYKATVSWVGALTGKATVSVQLVSRTATLSTWNVLGSATYSKAGAYTVKVTVADAGGKSLSTSKTTFKVSGPQRAPQSARQSAGRVAATAAVLSMAASPARPSGQPAHAVNDAALAAVVAEWTTSSRSSPAADASKDAGKGLAELLANYS